MLNKFLLVGICAIAFTACDDVKNQYTRNHVEYYAIDTDEGDTISTRITYEKVRDGVFDVSTKVSSKDTTTVTHYLCEDMTEHRLKEIIHRTYKGDLYLYCK